MLYVFHVDSGKMMRFDMNLALERLVVYLVLIFVYVFLNSKYLFFDFPYSEYVAACCMIQGYIQHLPIFQSYSYMFIFICIRVYEIIFLTIILIHHYVCTLLIHNYYHSFTNNGMVCLNIVRFFKVSIIK